MKELIKVIAFDADDTLWSNEPFFQDIEKQYTDLLKSYGTPEDISAALFQNSLKILIKEDSGYEKSACYHR